ncbi:MAG TPA: AidA/PixA family protein [Pyrinomonadaceae bacterium]|jgi:hypothetical protein
MSKAAAATPSAKPSVLAGQLINVLISVDTNTILANPGVNPAQVIFMTDNNASGGSSGEGTDELNTACHLGDTIQWRVTAQNQQTPVEFLAFKNSNGDVFGFNPPAGGPSLYQAEAVARGQEIYQILILVNGTQTFQWDPYVTCS